METAQIEDHAVEDQISDDEASSLYVDFENNGLLWVPPEPENDDDDYYGYDYDDDDDDDDVKPKQVVDEPPRLEQVFTYSPSEQESIKVLLSSRCEWKGTVCERSHLLRIKYYDSFDRPLGRFLRDRLFDQNNLCSSCEMPPEAHVECYTHRQGTISILVKKLPDDILPGEKDGKIWMWHRCLRCPRYYYGVPPATRRIVMSDAASGLSFGKFLELSFSNDASASCGHSLHRDCLRFYGFGKMVACFRYVSIEVYSVYLSPSKLNFNNESGPRMLLPVGVNDTVIIPVYNDEPSSIISYALVSTDYNSVQASKNEPVVSFADNGPHGEVKYTVTCYYGKRFEELRRICCSSESDFVRSLSRCDKWEARGGESKTLDGRFIVKQVTKTELESFIKFAPRYFEYVSESIGSGFPTCLAKMFGVYEVTSKHLKNGKETKMYVVVIENVLFGRNPSRLYDLKGSSRSRYNPDPSGSNKVLLDQNLIEEMPTSPIFVGNESKRLLERAIWNDTAFLASIDVMDYSLLVGVDDEKNELVFGIINIMRQYTWDKHLETWFTGSGIFGGPKNTLPTIVNPKDYKKRFRKAMSVYFLTVPCSQAKLSNENSDNSAQSTTFSDP
ncbi:hypothetical protein CASFOL_025837 [Castilleja foliolosa]|uniref:PIPK domain-containing protein n=1 Tax=Castilleja foliolosa TaxID=1961234 RepID=A0ABD3CT41_9LAMI